MNAFYESPERAKTERANRNDYLNNSYPDVAQIETVHSQPSEKYAKDSRSYLRFRTGFD
jgi:hypothetical protein